MNRNRKRGWRNQAYSGLRNASKYICMYVCLVCMARTAIQKLRRRATTQCAFGRASMSEPQKHAPVCLRLAQSIHGGYNNNNIHPACVRFPRACMPEPQNGHQLRLRTVSRNIHARTIIASTSPRASISGPE